MLVPFLAASTELSIFLHKCSCEGKVIATLFVEHKCHDLEVSSCCESKSEALNFKDAVSSCGCKTEHYKVKVDDLFTFTSTTVVNSNFDFLAIHFLSNSRITTELATNLVQVKSLYLPINSPPIKPAGRILINLLHQSKTPDTIS